MAAVVAATKAATADVEVGTEFGVVGKRFVGARHIAGAGVAVETEGYPARMVLAFVEFSTVGHDLASARRGGAMLHALRRAAGFYFGGFHARGNVARGGCYHYSPTLSVFFAKLYVVVVATAGCPKGKQGYQAQTAEKVEDYSLHCAH